MITGADSALSMLLRNVLSTPLLATRSAELSAQFDAAAVEEGAIPRDAVGAGMQNA